MTFRITSLPWKAAGSLLKFWQWPARWRALWSHHFPDLRVIVDREGQLTYLSISGTLQQWAVRAVLLIATVASTLVISLAATTVWLHLGNQALTDAQRRVYEALAGGTGHGVTEAGVADIEALLDLARGLRERDVETRRLVASATADLGADNDRIRGLLDAAGLTDAVITRSVTPETSVGGDRSEPQPEVALLDGRFAENSSENQMLRSLLGLLPSTMPLEQFRISSGFGYRRHPLTGDTRFHWGADLIPLAGDDIHPPLAGRVILAKFYNDFGNTIILQHERGVETLYGHLDRMFVREGQPVTPESRIGTVGSTGSTNGKHLHFEISLGGHSLDPQRVIEAARHVQQTKE